MPTQWLQSLPCCYRLAARQTNEDGQWRALRGLRWCEACTSRLHRDGAAARNILAAGRAERLGLPRPAHLRRGAEINEGPLVRCELQEHELAHLEGHRVH